MVRSQLPAGLDKQSFMVVPLTSIGPLDVGWITPAIVDDTSAQGQGNAPGKAVLSSRPELSSDSSDQKGESLEHVEAESLPIVEEPEASVEDEADTSPQLDAEDGEDFPVWGIVILALGIPAFFICAFAVWKKQASLKEESSLDNGGKQQSASAQPTSLQLSDTHWAVPPEPTAIKVHPIPSACENTEVAAGTPWEGAGKEPQAYSDSTSSPTRTTAPTQAFKTKVADAHVESSSKDLESDSTHSSTWTTASTQAFETKVADAHAVSSPKARGCEYVVGSPVHSPARTSAATHAFRTRVADARAESRSLRGRPYVME
jgi:hypothetical protein